MAHPARRVAPTGSRGNTYSPQRLRLVLFLLTAVTLPVVIGCSVVIFYYLKFNVMVDRRLQGERWQVPARLYARPLVLRLGMPMTVRSFVNVLNGLKYEEKDDIPAAPGASWRRWTRTGHVDRAARRDATSRSSGIATFYCERPLTAPLRGRTRPAGGARPWQSP